MRETQIQKSVVDKETTSIERGVLPGIGFGVMKVGVSDMSRLFFRQSYPSSKRRHICDLIASQPLQMVGPIDGNRGGAYANNAAERIIFPVLVSPVCDAISAWAISVQDANMKSRSPQPRRA